MSEEFDDESSLPEAAREPEQIVTNVGGMKVTANKDGVVIDAPNAGGVANDNPTPFNPAEAFVGLPMGLLICGPIIEVAKGQAELCKLYMEYVMNLAYSVEKDAQGKSVKKTNIVTFELERPAIDGSGNIGTKKVVVNAPLLSLVPVPAFLMEEATVRFEMEVKESKIDKASTESKAEVKTGFSFWGFRTDITGGVTHKSESTVSSSTTAKYEIYARARQQPPAEGMAKLTSLFASIVEPIDVGGA